MQIVSKYVPLLCSITQQMQSGYLHTPLLFYIDYKAGDFILFILQPIYFISKGQKLSISQIW